MELSNKKELNQLDILQDQFISCPSEKSIANQNKKIEKILILDTETTGLDENKDEVIEIGCILFDVCLLYTSPSPRDKRQSRMPSSA